MSATDLAGLATASQEEVARQMTIYNACRYCEGLCAVFPAMELRRAFGPADVDYLASLCYNCGACHYDCQYAPPHAFAVNVPPAMMQVREESYARFAWPAALAPLFERNGLWIALAAALSVAGFVLGFALWSDPGALTASGDFYAVMPHGAMVAVFAPLFLFALLAMAMSVRRFWRQADAGNPDASPSSPRMPRSRPFRGPRDRPAFAPALAATSGRPRDRLTPHASRPDRAGTRGTLPACGTGDVAQRLRGNRTASCGPSRRAGSPLVHSRSAPRTG